MLTPHGAMKLAIHEGQKGLGFVSPNPAVGCVIVESSGHLLAKGHHRFYGGAHAEIEAFEKIEDKSRLKDATVYVTLEPCAHEGKTPSCAKKLATLPIKKVVYGLIDPNPLVAGQGLEILRAAGIAVEKSEGLDSELEELCETFLWNQRQHLPFVSLKVATSLDGQLAHISGASKWITGERAREEAHVLRAHHDAVLIGRETFLRDNPALNIRHARFEGKKNKVIILDSRGEVLSRLSDSNVLRAHAADDVIVVTATGQAATVNGVQIWPCAMTPSGAIDLKALLSKCYENKITSILVEGGARVLSSFLQQKLAQRFYQFMAPQIIGAQSGVSFSKDLAIGQLGERIRLGDAKFKPVGDDILVTGRL